MDQEEIEEIDEPNLDETQNSECLQDIPVSKQKFPSLKQNNGEIIATKCPFCLKTFDSVPELNTHYCTPDTDQQNDPVLRFVQGYKCELCNKFFSQQFHYQVHMAKHTGVKPFVCPVCEKAFARKDVMQVHLKVHSEEKDFICEICSAAFKQKYHLARHMNTHLEKTTIVCEICGLIFDRIDRYNTHVRKIHLSLLE